ncbi:pentatricopeptide repeat-containing protein [Carex littledalei]|uniref:Pentatricopeptide repeat-containing protein n=1 Tax=Carex littledalei TaxID=544730 RepID=A0A833R8B0_9POAL|nr:pentatricopeptide repeat-containing protein [Carex littledalei]
MAGFNDLRRLAYGASIVAREAAKRSKAVEAATSGDIAGTLRPAADIRARYLVTLGKVGNLTEARLDPHVGTGSIHNLERNYKDKSTYVSMIRDFTLLGWVDTLPRLVIEMQEMGHTPSRNLYCTVTVSLCKAERDCSVF